MICVTGGAGFIGKRLIAEMTAKKFHVRVIDNLINSQQPSKNSYIDFILGDITQPELLVEQFKGCTLVIHLAADTRVIDSINDPELNFKVNAAGTLNVLNAALATDVNYVVAASSGGAILGDAAPPLNEDMLPRPISPYGASKLALEGYLSAYRASYGLKSCALRFSNVYGEGSQFKQSVVTSFLKKIQNNESIEIFGDGEQTRDYVHVDDIVSGILQAIDKEASGVFNLGSGIPTSVNQLLLAMQEVCNDITFPPLTFKKERVGEIKHAWCDIKKASDLLHYSPQVSLHDGLEKTWKWLKKYANQEHKVEKRF